MKKDIFIAGTGTDIGKTYTTLSLIKALSARGIKVGVMKPIETGVKTTPEDASALFELAKQYNPALHALHLEDICPLSFHLPAAPEIARGGIPIDFDLISECHEKIAKLSDIVLVEGAGGLLTPVEGSYFMLNLSEMLNCKIILVSHAKLGCINDIMLNEKMLKFGRQDFIIAVNQRIDDKVFEQNSLPYLQKTIKDLFVLPNQLDSMVDRIISGI